jgi:hypothetical protein
MSHGNVLQREVPCTPCSISVSKREVPHRTASFVHANRKGPTKESSRSNHLDATYGPFYNYICTITSTNYQPFLHHTHTNTVELRWSELQRGDGDLGVVGVRALVAVASGDQPQREWFTQLRWPSGMKRQSLGEVSAL